MPGLIDLVTDTFPANNDVGVPLLSDITITLSGLDYDEDSLKEGMFVEGPDTDQYIGPGLLDQVFPANISQGNLDDFLKSPGYQGIVDGVTTVSGIAGDTVVTFNPGKPLAALTEYTVNMTSILESDGETEISGFITFGFTTGTGSIETVPSTVSSSVLSAGLVESAITADDPLTIVRVTPDNHSVENDVELDEIIVEFNKPLDAASVANAIIEVKAIAATSHPNLGVIAAGNLATVVTVDGNKLKIKI